MSCRIANAGDDILMRPVAWRRLDPAIAENGVAGVVAVSELEQAREECRALQERLLELEQSIEPMKQEIWQTGFHAGQIDAQKAAQKQVEEERRRVADAVAYMSLVRGEWRREIERGAVALAMAVARRVLNRELSIDPDAVHGIVRVAVERTEGQELRRVRVAAAQAQAVRACLSREAPGVELVTDPALQPGEIRFELEQGSMDASIDAQLEEIERGFADTVDS